MKLYVGGAFQGQEELARMENPGAQIFPDFHETIRAKILEGADLQAFAQQVISEYPDAVIVANEVGAGVVPIEAEERAFREGVGRVLCRMAAESEAVVRVVCGIGVRIK